MTSKKISVRDLVLAALMAALLCIAGPLSIPIGPIPISLAAFAVCLSAVLLGWKMAPVSVIVYLLLGAVDLPVFSGFMGGVSRLVGPTGGYLVGYIFLALIGGFACDRFKLVGSAIGLILGMAVCYLFGTVWFTFVAKCTFGYALSVCVYPFVVLDLCKIAAALVIGKLLRARIPFLKR